MTLGEALNIATASLWAHKMRSVLTLLGVVIGVTSVIAVVSLINGLNDYVAAAISSNLSADVFMISRAPSNITSVDQWAESQKRKKFHFDDYEALRDNCRSCVAVAANLNKTGQVKYGTNTLDDSAILGFTHEMPEVYSRELAEGRYYTRLDVARHAPVCDVGFDIVDKLIPGSDPIGKIIHVDTRGVRNHWRREEERLDDGAVRGQLGDHAADHLRGHLRRQRLGSPVGESCWKERDGADDG